VCLPINRTVKKLVWVWRLVDDFPGSFPFQVLGAAIEHPHNGATWKIIGRSNVGIGIIEVRPAGNTRMTNRDAVASIARGRNITRVVKIERVEFILLPQLPVRWKEIGNLVGLSVRERWGSANIVITADRAVPAVRGQLDRTRQPKRLKPAAPTGSDILRTPADLVIGKERTELADFEERNLVAELDGIDVFARRRSWSSRPAGNATVITRRVNPSVRTAEIATPSRMRVVIIVVSRVKVIGQKDLFYVVKVERQLGTVFGPGERRQKKARQDCDNSNDNEQFNQREGPGGQSRRAVAVRCWMLRMFFGFHGLFSWVFRPLPMTVRMLGIP